MLPILHLNGYKISGPTVLGRSSDEDIHVLLSGHGYEVHFVEGNDPQIMHQQFAQTLDTCYKRIRAVQEDARTHGVRARPRSPVIVLRTPKGWTGPKMVDGVPIEGTFRSRQVPVADVQGNPEHLHILEAWMRSYLREKLFDDQGHLLPELAAYAALGLAGHVGQCFSHGGRQRRNPDQHGAGESARPGASHPAPDALAGGASGDRWTR